MPDPMDKRYKKIAIEAATESGLFIRRSMGKVKEVSYKGRINIVTDVDVTAEEMILEKIHSAFPGHSIVSEESGLHDKGSPYRWIIDPLDGTTNYTRSFPFFCVSIALEYEGVMALGVIYDPLRDELFCAERGGGARLNKKRIVVSKTKTLAKSFLATGFAYGIREVQDDNIQHFKDFLMRVMAIRRAGSAALDLAYVACGRFDGFWELDLHPWDVAAGYLIVREAGGRITRFDGSKYSYLDKDLLASNGLIHNQMISILT